MAHFYASDPQLNIRFSDIVHFQKEVPIGQEIFPIRILQVHIVGHFRDQKVVIPIFFRKPKK